MLGNKFLHQGQKKNVAVFPLGIGFRVFSLVLTVDTLNLLGAEKSDELIT
jgi:hypothetical protein